MVSEQFRICFRQELGMSQKKRIMLFVKIAVVIAAAVVFAALFVIPFNSRQLEREYTFSPIVPWYMIREEFDYFEEPSNAPQIGTWDFPDRCTRHKLIVFGKEYRSETYLEYKDGRVTKI